MNVRNFPVKQMSLKFRNGYYGHGSMKIGYIISKQVGNIKRVPY